MTPAIFRHRKWIPDGNINIISNGGGLIPISETGSYGRPQGHINCLRVVALFSFELEPPPIDGWASGGPSEEIAPKTCTRSAHGDIVKRETNELNRKTGELNRNRNVNKMSYLAPAGTRTGDQAGR